MVIKKEKGVTLSILIVTIVILLIIMGVSLIDIVNEGIIDKTQNTVDSYNNKVNKTYEYEENEIKQNIVDFKVSN